MGRLRALMRKEFIHMRRDPRTLMSIFIMPLLQLFLLGYAANTDITNVSAAVVDQDQSQASRALLGAYRASGFFMLDHVAQSEAEVANLIDSGQVKAGIIIPPGYAKDLDSGRGAQIAVLIDGSDPSIATPTLSAATLVGQSYTTSIQLEQLVARGASLPGAAALDVRSRVLYNPDLLSSYNMIPGLIGTILQMTTMLLTSFAIVRERENGTIEQLIVTPIRNWELMVAKITPYVAISMINVVVVLLVGTVWFCVPIRGSVPLLLALTGLFILPNLGIGLLISTVAKNQQQAQFFIQPIILPTFFLSGFLFPLATLPPVLQVVSTIIPLRYFLIIVRGVVVKGIGFEFLIPQVVALSIFAVILVGLAISRFRKSLD
jgi:ABC-2 type transport system permease protein